MKEIALICAVIGVASVVGVGATRFVASVFWVAANGGPLDSTPMNTLDYSPPVTGWNTATGTPVTVKR